MTSRAKILDGAAAILRDPTGPRLSLESAARASGLSKPGVMYHFPTKAALVLGVLEHVIDGWEAAMIDRLEVPFDEATVQQRIRAYVGGSVAHAGRDRAQLVLYAEHADTLSDAWAARIEPWVRMPDGLPDSTRARLEAARLAADGAWIAVVSGICPPRDEDLPRIAAVLESLVAEP